MKIQEGSSPAISPKRASSLVKWVSARTFICLKKIQPFYGPMCSMVLLAHYTFFSILAAMWYNERRWMFNVLVRGETDKSSRHSSQSDTLVPHHCAHYSNELDNIQGECMEGFIVDKQKWCIILWRLINVIWVKKICYYIGQIFLMLTLFPLSGCHFGIPMPLFLNLRHGYRSWTLGG